MDYYEAMDVINEHLVKLYAEEQENGPDHERQEFIEALELAKDCILYKRAMG